MPDIKLALLLATVLPMPSFAAAKIWAVEYSGNVYSIDSATGGGSVVATSNLPGANAIADDANGALFTVVSPGFGVRPALFTLNPQTGAGTLVTTLSPGVLDCRALAFAPDGTLFAISDGGYEGTPNEHDRLVKIDLSTGLITNVGLTGFRAIQGMDFAPDGTLYGWDVGQGLLILNVLSGAATDVKPVGFETIDIQSIAFDRAGVLFGCRDSLYTVDPTTGTSTLVGQGNYSDIRGIAILIPESSALIGFAMGMLTVFTCHPRLGRKAARPSRP
jgi:hypothetical protein